MNKSYDLLSNQEPKEWTDKYRVRVAFVFLSRMCMCHVTVNALIHNAAGADRRPESEGTSPGSLDAIVIVCYCLASPMHAQDSRNGINH